MRLRAAQLPPVQEVEKDFKFLKPCLVPLIFLPTSFPKCLLLPRKYSAMAQAYSNCPLSGHSIRVLVLKLDAGHNAALHCSLEEISLDAIPIRRYNALSYVWGAKIGTVPLLCDGKTILITPNCEEALRHLRYRKPVTLWVDAVCTYS